MFSSVFTTHLSSSYTEYLLTDPLLSMIANIVLLAGNMYPDWCGQIKDGSTTTCTYRPITHCAANILHMTHTISGTSHHELTISHLGTMGHNCGVSKDLWFSGMMIYLGVFVVHVCDLLFWLQESLHHHQLWRVMVISWETNCPIINNTHCFDQTH